MSESQRVDALVSRIEQLEAHVERLERERGDGDREVAPSPSAPVSRRRLLGLAGAAAAGAAGAAIATASPAGATTGNMQFGGDNDAGTDDTTLTSTNTSNTLLVAHTGTGAGGAIKATTTSTTASAFGVQGEASGASGTTFGVRGANASTTPGSAAVRAEATGATGATTGVNATTASTGPFTAAVRAAANGGTGVTYGVQASVASSTSAATAVEANALGATGATFGLRGVNASTDPGAVGVKGEGVNGVYGSSAAGFSLRAGSPAATGAPLKLDPAAAQGPPLSGTHTEGEFWVDNLGVLWLCKAGGSPGDWKAVMLAGMSNGFHTGSTGMNSAIGPVFALASAGSGAAAHLRLTPHTSKVGPPSGAHLIGEFFMDTQGVLHRCVTAGDPGIWVRDSPFVPLASPVRVYDSRSGQPNQAPNTQGSLTFTSAPPSSAFRDVACNKNASSGTTVVPAEARTLLMNLAIVSISGVGALNAYATGTTQPATANINWSAGGQVLSNAVTSACSATQHVNFAIVASSGAATHLIVDVIGYYL